MEAVGGVCPRLAVIPAGTGCTGTVRRHPGGRGLPLEKMGDGLFFQVVEQQEARSSHGGTKTVFSPGCRRFLKA